MKRQSAPKMCLHLVILTAASPSAVQFSWQMEHMRSSLEGRCGTVCCWIQARISSSLWKNDILTEILMGKFIFVVLFWFGIERAGAFLLVGTRSEVKTATHGCGVNIITETCSLNSIPAYSSIFLPSKALIDTCRHGDTKADHQDQKPSRSATPSSLPQHPTHLHPTAPPPTLFRNQSLFLNAPANQCNQ